MLEIITPQPTDVVADVTGDYVTITFGPASLTLPAMARPMNNAEIIYLGDNGALQFVPGTTPKMAAVLACGSVPMTLTLCPLSLQPAQPQDPMTV